MYKNLETEMHQQNVDIGTIAKALSISPKKVQLKLAGQCMLTVDECLAISALFPHKNSIDYLFQR